MEINKTILLLISLSCLFSLSASRPVLSPASAPFSFYAQSPSSYDNDNYAAFNILPEGTDPALQRICQNTDHPVECVLTVAPFLQNNVEVEPLSVLQIQLEAVTNKTKEALAKSLTLLLNPNVQEPMASRLETCVDNYNSILDCNQKVIDAIYRRDPYELNVELSSNVEDVHGCSDAFDEAGIESPIKEIDLLIGKMVSNSLAIGVDMVHF